MKRVLLINPWIYDFKAYDFWLKPLGLLYLAAYLRQAGYEIDYLDCLDRYHPMLAKKSIKFPPVDCFGRGKFYAQEIEKPEVYKPILRKYKRYGMPIEVISEILANMKKPDFIGVTSIMTYWYLGVFDMIKILKSYFPKVPIILGGIYATLCYDHARKFSGADYVISGKAEENLYQLLPDLKPISFLELPYPAFDLYTKLDYACVLTSQGCPFNCQYCAVPYLNENYLYRDPFSVIDEIQYYQSLGVNNIAFYDDALLANPNFSRLLDEIIKRNIKINFHTPNGIHPRFITQELADKMYHANFQTIYLSLETVDDNFHQAIDNKVSVNEFVKAVAYFQNSGFSKDQIHAYLLVGIPELSPASIIKSIDFIHSLGVMPHLAEYSPIPNTTMFKQKKLALLNEPCLHNNTIFPAIDEHLKNEIQQIKSYLSKLRTKVKANC
ncbi:MAG: B12-binding domain-containing radical SAM protein [candidate division WOR-3 bacterium]